MRSKDACKKKSVARFVIWFSLVFLQAVKNITRHEIRTSQNLFAVFLITSKILSEVALMKYG